MTQIRSRICRQAMAPKAAAAAEHQRPPEADRRETLLAAAEEVFLRKGYVLATMDDIAQAAGMSKKTIYHVFRSKKELFDALMLEKLPLPELPAEHDGRSADQILRAILMELGRIVLSKRHVALTRLVLAEIASAPEVGDVVKKQCTEVETAIGAWLKRQAAAKTFTIPDVDSAVAMLFGMVFGEFHWHLLLDLRDPPSENMLAERVDWSLSVFMREFGNAGTPKRRAPRVL